MIATTVSITTNGSSTANAASKTAMPGHDAPEVIPARMLNEFAYCPRLGYLEWVQGEFADNLETAEGRFGHRVVDKEDRRAFSAPGKGKESEEGSAKKDAPLEKEEPDTIHARSVTLSSETDGLIAKMDLIDLDGNAAVPVDYKRGRVPDNPERSWEPERVQLCAQGLILRENGFDCDHGVLYYIESKRRVEIPFDDALVARTRELAEEMRAAAAEGRIPPPLEDSPKCPRCSLVGICLPDETCLLSDPASAGTDRKTCIRRMIPALDDASPLYVQEQGAYLGKRGEELTVSRKKEVVSRTRLLGVSQVCLLGNVQISAQALREITSRGIPVCHFSYGGWFCGITRGMEHKNVELRIAQFRAADDAGDSLRFAKAFVEGKIQNCRTLLRRHLNGESGRLLDELKNYRQMAAKATDSEVLLGIEGTAAKTYFAGLKQLFKEETGFELDGRNRRPPRDRVNAMLSFVYAMLTKEATVALYAAGFDPMLGFFHRPRYGRPSAALDLIEEFRPIIADSVVLTLVNNGEITEDHFIARAGAVALTPAGRKAVIGAFERRMETLIKHPIFKYRISYRRVLLLQARLLARTVLGEIGKYPAFVTR